MLARSAPPIAATGNRRPIPAALSATRLSADQPVVLGVAARAASALGASVLVVRVALVVLVFAAGWGVALYAVAWLLGRHAPAPAPRPVALRHDLGVVAATAAQLAFVDARIGGADPTLLWPVTLVAFALALAESGRSGAPDRPRRRLGQVLAGGVLMIAGLSSALAGSQDVATLVRTAPAAAVLVGGLGLVLMPSLRRVITEAELDRRHRAQAEARADLAAHLHDSVLQTLTLIQNRSEEPEVAALAHRQERELRRWLYAGDVPLDPTTFRRALDAAVDEVEDQYLTVAARVVVGDAPLSEPLHAVVGAVREAVVNAAKFAGVNVIDVFAEVGLDRSGSPTVRAYVRDRGVGFDPATVPVDRRGLRDSIEGRVARMGGGTTVRSAPGEGTEVQVWWPA